MGLIPRIAISASFDDLGILLRKMLSPCPFQIQFCCLIGLAVVTRLPGLRCGYPQWISVITFFYIFVLLGLFANFYIKVNIVLEL